MNILRPNFYSIARQGKFAINKGISKASFTWARYKSDTSGTKSNLVSMVDVKDVSKNDIIKRQDPPQTLKKENKMLWFLRKVPFLKIDELKLKQAGYMLYEDFVDSLDYGAFFEEYGLKDTFYSWFVVTELHIWMLSTRTTAEGEDGTILRNGFIECLWVDVLERIKALGIISQQTRREEIWQLSEQLQAAFIGYDEGLQSDDVVLAGALWRRMYQMGDAVPEHLEKLVRYVRRNLVLLDNTSRDNLIQDKHINWIFH